MNAQMSCIMPSEKVRLRITTGYDKDISVYEFGLPDNDGFRQIQRNDDQPFRGKIMGPVMGVGELDIDGVTSMTQLDSNRILVHFYMLEIGKPMGIWTEPQAQSTNVSRPIIKIEIV